MHASKQSCNRRFSDGNAQGTIKRPRLGEVFLSAARGQRHECRLLDHAHRCQQTHLAAVWRQVNQRRQQPPGNTGNNQGVSLLTALPPPFLSTNYPATKSRNKYSTGGKKKVFNNPLTKKKNNKKKPKHSSSKKQKIQTRSKYPTKPPTHFETSTSGTTQ